MLLAIARHERALIVGIEDHTEFQDRVKVVLKEVEEAKGKVILFIDKIHLVLGAGEAFQTNAWLRCIVTTSFEEYRKYIDKLKMSPLSINFNRCIMWTTTLKLRASFMDSMSSFKETNALQSSVMLLLRSHLTLLIPLSYPIAITPINCIKSFKMWSSRKLSFLLGLIRFLLLLQAPTVAMAANPFRADCDGDAYNSSSSFGRSLSGLLSSLTFLSSNSNSTNATAGASRDSVYGLYMCQGDLSGSNCQSCIQMAVAGTNQSCPGVRRAIVYYDQCHLSYSDANFFGVVDADGFNMTNPLEVTSSRMAFNILSDLVQAVPQRRPLMFATNVSDMYPLFALAQCTADLSPDGCRRCLTASLAAIENCCIQRKGWRYLSPSCWIRYEPTPFFGNYPNNLSTYIIRSQCSSLDVQSDDLSARTANLRGLFDDLSAQAPATGFYSSSAGDGGDRMYDLGLCAGDDATRGECAACLATAGRAIANECPNKTEGYMWYGLCFLKYSQQRDFGELDTDVHTFCSGAAPVTAEFSYFKFESLQELDAAVAKLEGDVNDNLEQCSWAMPMKILAPRPSRWNAKERLIGLVERLCERVVRQNQAVPK
ncbi:hypothetical protein ZIOFF_075388 [Zingiber officinale]|uniref:Gnk2-homologous domain-containing protein n=1 Tax=Zingiber officinale TaxID=94328 RepID=A0A8J5E8J3_ZINOF|nr:hypothetical protein ZIOFF_075388 [Zingiber officinale]